VKRGKKRTACVHQVIIQFYMISQVVPKIDLFLYLLFM